MNSGNYKLTVKLQFSCLQSQIWKIQMRWPRSAALWFVKWKQNPLCIWGNILVLYIVGYYFKTIITWFFSPVQSHHRAKIYWLTTVKSYSVILSPKLVCYLFCLQCVYLSNVTHKEISSCCRSYFLGTTKWKGEELGMHPERKSI